MSGDAEYLPLRGVASNIDVSQVIEFRALTLSGSITALATPFGLQGGALDLDACGRLIDAQLAGGTRALVMAGSTGEAAALDDAEFTTLLEFAVARIGKRVPVLADLSLSATKKTIAQTRRARDAGVDFALVVAPAYVRPTQEGMYRHFAKIAETVDLPLILYNVPGRTVADMSNETILRLANVPGVVGVKEATGNIDRAAHLIKSAPAHFAIYSGDDLTAIALMLLGGHGNISVTANVAPRAMAQLCKAALAADAKTAREIHLKLLSLHRNLFIESNPIPVKWVLQQMGRMEGGIRLPLTPLDARYHDVVRAAMHEAGLAG